MSSVGDNGVEVNPNCSGNHADQVRVTYPDPFLRVVMPPSGTLKP